jgi:hypothetical protein
MPNKGLRNRFRVLRQDACPAAKKRFLIHAEKGDADRLAKPMAPECWQPDTGMDGPDYVGTIFQRLRLSGKPRRRAEPAAAANGGSRRRFARTMSFAWLPQLLNLGVRRLECDVF